MPFSPDLPIPPVPRECSLHGYAFFPLFLDRLLASWFHRCATPAEWRAGVLLWMKSWREVPAGSLPSDDRELCALAEIGNNMREWKKLKEVSLHGWDLYSDGRLYHPVVTEVTLRAWQQRVAIRNRGKAGAEARWGDSSKHGTEHSSKHAPANGSKHSSADGKLREIRERKVAKEATFLPSPNTPEPDGSVVLPPLPPDASPLRGSRLQQELVDLPSDWANSAQAARLRAGLPELDPALEWEKFRNYWLARAGKDGRKLDWRRTWVNWVLNAKATPRNGVSGTPLVNLFDGAWRAANELEPYDEQAGDRGQDRGPAQPLLGRK